MADEPRQSASVTTAPFPAAAPPPVPDGDDQPYRPVSLLAVAGLVLAGIFSFLVLLGGIGPIATKFPLVFAMLLVLAPLGGVLVALVSRKRTGGAALRNAGVALGGLATLLGLGGLVAFSGANPWLLNVLWWGVAVAAVAVCLLAKSRINTSEGTLSGLPLANWGLGLTLFFGLNYAAYLTSNTFAIRGQAKQCAEEFLNLVKDTSKPDAIDQAFLRCLTHRERPTADVRHAIEVQFNISRDPRGSQSGVYSGFQHMDFVRLMRLGPCTVKFERVGRSEYNRGNYEVDLIYLIDGRMGAFEMVVSTVGMDVKEGGGTRLWHVDLNRTMFTRPVSATADGNRFDVTAGVMRDFLVEWMKKNTFRLKVGQFLDTLPPGEREQSVGLALLEEQAVVGWTGLTVGGAWPAGADRLAFRKAYAEFLKGAVVDGSELWVSKKGTEQEMIDDVIKTVTCDPTMIPDIQPYEKARIPAFKENGDASEFSFPIRIVTQKVGDVRGRYLVEADLVITGPLVDARPRQVPFRISKVKLIRGQTAPDPRMMQQGGPGGG